MPSPDGADSMVASTLKDDIDCVVYTCSPKPYKTVGYEPFIIGYNRV